MKWSNRNLRGKTFIIFFMMSSAGNGLTSHAGDSSHPVKIIVDGKRYPSLHAYKLKRLKEELKQVLSAGQIREFSEEELCAIIKELKEPDADGNSPDTQKEETRSPSPDATGDIKEPSRGPDKDPDTVQMKEMLHDYLNRHKDVSPVVFDPQKVKTIIIQPSQGTPP